MQNKWQDVAAIASRKICGGQENLDTGVQQGATLGCRRASERRESHVTDYSNAPLINSVYIDANNPAGACKG